MDVLGPADKELRNIESKISSLDKTLENIFDEAIVNLNKTKSFIKEEQKEPFIQLNFILKSLKERDLKPGIKWASENHDLLKARKSDLEFKLHKLNFLKILNNNVTSSPQPYLEDHELRQPTTSCSDTYKEMDLTSNLDKEDLSLTSSSSQPTMNRTKLALTYAAKKLTPFAVTNSKEFQKLMGCLILNNKMNLNNAMNPNQTNLTLVDTNTENVVPMETITTSEVIEVKQEDEPEVIQKLSFPPTNAPPILNSDEDMAWEEIMELFVQEACALMGFATESPLSVSFACGVKAYPALLNIKQMMQQRHVTGVWNSHVKDELPVEVDLGNDYRFHSIFACPILRQQSSTSNPPMRLKCGHVISKEALNKLANSSKVKCPYCPEELAVADAKQIHF